MQLFTVKAMPCAANTIAVLHLGHYDPPIENIANLVSTSRILPLSVFDFSVTVTGPSVLIQFSGLIQFNACSTYSLHWILTLSIKIVQGFWQKPVHLAKYQLITGETSHVVYNGYTSFALREILASDWSV